MSKKGRNFQTINLSDFIIVRKTDEQYTKNLIQYWKEGGMTNLTVSLKCPISKNRLEMPCRGEDCTHIQCFDGLYFLKMNEKQFGNWPCNICQKPSPLNKLFVDGLFLDILKTVSDDVENIYFDINGNWTDSNPDSKASKLDYSVIDLSETLEVIDLTGSDDEDDKKRTPGNTNAVTPKQLDNGNKNDNDKTTPGNSRNGIDVNTPRNAVPSKNLDNDADKVDKKKGTPGSSKKSVDDNTAGKAVPSKKHEECSKTKETNGKNNDKGKADPNGNKDKKGDDNKENDILRWYRGLNTNYHAVRNQRHNNKTSSLPYARPYSQRQNNSSYALRPKQRKGFRRPLYQHNRYNNVDYSTPFCQQALLPCFSAKAKSLTFGKSDNFSIRIEL